MLRNLMPPLILCVYERQREGVGVGALISGQNQYDFNHPHKKLVGSTELISRVKHGNMYRDYYDAARETLRKCFHSTSK